MHVERILNIMCLPRGPPTAYLVTISVTTKICFMIKKDLGQTQKYPPSSLLTGEAEMIALGRIATLGLFFVQ